MTDEPRQNTNEKPVKLDLTFAEATQALVDVVDPLREVSEAVESCNTTEAAPEPETSDSRSEHHQ